MVVEDIDITPELDMAKIPSLFPEMMLKLSAESPVVATVITEVPEFAASLTVPVWDWVIAMTTSSTVTVYDIVEPEFVPSLIVTVTS